MTVQFKRHVKVICDIEVGDTVRTGGYGHQLDGRDHTVLNVREFIGKCESGFMIKIKGYELDSGWFLKIPEK